MTLRRSKTDQEGHGTTKGIPFGSHHGKIQPTRLSAYAVALVVKRAAEAGCLDPDQFALGFGANRVLY